jgi:hypothetical protein
MLITSVNCYLRSFTYFNSIGSFRIRQCFFTRTPFFKYYNILPCLLVDKSLLSTDTSLISHSSHSKSTTIFKESQTLVKANGASPNEERVVVPDSLYRRLVLEVLSHDSAVLDSYERFVVAASINLGLLVPPVLSYPFSPQRIQTLPSNLIKESKRSKVQPIKSLKRQPKTSDRLNDGPEPKSSASKPKRDLGSLLKTFARPGAKIYDPIGQTHLNSELQTTAAHSPAYDVRQTNRSSYFGELLDVQRPPYSIWLRTLLKSVHVHKTHRVQYQIKSHACIFTFKELTGSTADTLLEYLERNLPEGCAIKVTRERIEPIADEMLDSIRARTQSKRLVNPQNSENSTASTGNA